MEGRIKTKNMVQCRLKYWSFKRKHSNRKNRSCYETCMKSLIIKKLESLANFDEESKKILKKIEEREQKLNDIKVKLNS